MSEIKVDVQKTGFPVVIGSVNLWFDTSQEALLRFFDLEEEAIRRLTLFQKEIIESNLDSDIEENGVTKHSAEGALSLELKYLEIQYDLIFGDGTFEKLYAEYSDYVALSNTLEQVAHLVANKLEELAIKRENIAKERVKKYSKKSKTASQE